MIVFLEYLHGKRLTDPTTFCGITDQPTSGILVQLKVKVASVNLCIL